MADQRYILKPITNIDGKDPKRGHRLEIDEFLADNEVTNLFLIALAEIQKNSLKLWNGKPDWLTYYSLAGIHGQPRENWNDYENTPERGSTYGFCHHSADTFPTWHRPYIYLFESVVHDEMVRQAKAFQDEDEKQSYLDAAARFRLPYWDIIMPRNDEPTKPPPGHTEIDPTVIWGCPRILKAKSVYVKLPNGDPEKKKNGFWTIDNPLAVFKFPRAEDFQRSKDQGVERKLLDIPQTFNQKRTARVPTSISNKDTDNDAVDFVIQRQAAASATLIWQMLNPDQIEKALYHPTVEIKINEERSWTSFANDSVLRYRSGGYSFATVSCESFHDGIHVLIGTGQDKKGKSLLPEELQTISTGHMGDANYAAYDPIFWLHHNNIERLVCLHQAMHPEKYTDAQESKRVLYPFMKGTGEKSRDCYTSEDALIEQYWGSGFATPGNSQLSKSDAQRLIKKYLTDNYYWATNAKRVPGSLQGWPKNDNFEASWALRGPNAKPKANAVVHMKAISVVEGVPKLVAQEVPLEAAASPTKDKVITTSSILEEVRDVHSSLPKGALPEPVSAQEPPEQVTWNAHVRVRKFAFNGSFSVHVFVGHVKDDQPRRYMSKKNEAGFAGIFATPAGSGCASCDQNREDDILYEDVVPLTTILYDYLDASPKSETLIPNADIKTIPNLKPESVVPFLAENLQWRMIDLGSNLLSGQEQQAKLEVTVTSRQYLPPTRDNLMGAYGPYTPHPQITSTKPGGAGYVY